MDDLQESTLFKMEEEKMAEMNTEVLVKSDKISQKKKKMIV